MTDSTTDVQIRSLRVEEAGECAVLQRAMFPEYNTSRLGHSFCTSFFRQYALHDEAMCWGAWRAGKLVGYITGCHQSVGEHIHRSLLGKAILAAAIRPHAFCRVARLKRLAGYLASFLPWTRESTQDDKPVDKDETWLRLPSMSVLPEARGLGLAMRLMDTICDEGFARGFRYAWGTVVPTNEPIRRLFEKRGWVFDPNPSPDGTLYYWGTLPDTKGGAGPTATSKS